VLTKDKDSIDIGIIGFGRFGQFLAGILKNSQQVRVYDKSDRTSEAANIRVDCVDLDVVCQQNLLILAVPISEIESVLEQIKTKGKKNIIVMDIGSVKEYPAELMLRILPKDIEIIAAHPMFGPDSAKNGLAGSQMVFWPLRIGEENFRSVKKIFENLDLKIIEATPEEHDRQTALSLCLVYFIGHGLEEMGIRPQEIATLNFGQLLKIRETVANDSQQLFHDMQTHNRFAMPARKELLEALRKIDETLKNA